MTTINEADTIRSEVLAIINQMKVNIAAPSPTDIATNVVPMSLDDRLQSDIAYADRWADAMDAAIGDRQIMEIPEHLWRRMAQRAERLALAA